MNEDYKTKSAIVIDSYLFAELAIKLAESFGRIQYFAECLHDPFPDEKKGKVGSGFPGVERVLDWESHVDENDIFIFPDINWGPTQILLESMGKRVFGSRNGDQLENYRDKTKELMKKLGLAVGPYRVIIGLPELRKYLKTVKDKYLKVNLWRGNGETRRSTNYRIIETLLDRWEFELGPLKYTEQFIIEDDLPDKMEIGSDRYNADGVFPKSFLSGIEIKGMGYAGVFKNESELPKELLTFSNAIAPTLKEAGYRGFISDEIRVGKDRVPYMIDLCCRAPSPPSDLYLEMYENLADIIWNCAEGKIVEPIVKHKFGIQANIYADWSEFNFQCIEFPEKYRKNIKMRYAMKTKEGYYILPFKGNTRLCAVVNTGDSFEEAAEGIVKIQDEIKSFDKDFSIETLDQVKDEFKQLAAWGMKII